MTESEDSLAKIHAYAFFREFSFSKNQFIPPGEKSEAEFADHVIWIDDLLMVYQVKERQRDSGSPEKEEKWFNKKVLGEATKQVRDTINYLATADEITLENQRGHHFKLNIEKVHQPIKLVIYSPGPNLPVSSSDVRYYNSSSVGMIHVVLLSDYINICNTFITPAEISEYFLFREAIVNKWPKVSLPSECALVGQYVHGGGDQPSDAFRSNYYSLIKETEDFDIGNLLSLMGDRIEDFESEFDYYDILKEFAKLNRGDLRHIKKQITYCLEKARANIFAEPTRMIVTRTRCGFMFLPLQANDYERKTDILKKYTEASKYDLQLERQIGVSFVAMPSGEGVYINWYLVVFPWKHNPDADEFLEKNKMFRPLKEGVKQSRYRFE